MSQCRRSFETTETPWRVRDKSNFASDASIRLPLLADDFIDPKTGTGKVCAPPDFALSADRLNYKLAAGKMLSNAN